ncbi:hypothetical protein M409DRAFT_69082 [Zasmidium cellare ATCC 36951]|uniref:Amine oxidase n=1 Tax=Zasmidium cellare ATCC 36951 TaxID=1080233 RepID=A0A6A6C8A8_ZASCE|nr:uncharacterized protein M409DRAFT_69082 [Zasmidium cellare ATCC 36951]KAF2162488.1 hypothetical protein M409DRAFT_69082 [Zasmidium cellare ATCC 36951]
MLAKRFFSIFYLVGSAFGHPKPEQVDVAVVGAGLSGLAAAQKLIDSGKRVAVIEARDRVGGRVDNKKLKNGSVTELGAAFIGPTQDRVLALANELHLETFKEYNQGYNLAFVDGQRLNYSASSPSPPVDPTTTEQILEIITKIDTLAATLDVENPWNSPNATAWDAITLQDWAYETLTTTVGREAFEISVESIWSGTAEQLSFLYALAYVAGAGNQTNKGTFERLILTNDGGQESRIVGGTGLLPECLAGKIGRDKITLSNPIKSITQTRFGKYLIRGESKSFLAQNVIVAMSPPVAGLVEYSPPVSAKRQKLMQRMFMGNEGKMNAIYKTPFWRENGLSGQVQSTSGTVKATFDDSPADASYGAILGFIEAGQMKALDNATEAEIQKLVQEDYVRYFGPEAANAEEWVLVRWDNEAFSRGGPTALAGLHTFQPYGAALKQPDGGIHWAGTEASDYWPGYMDGAIRSGERAAEEILALRGRGW